MTTLPTRYIVELWTRDSVSGAWEASSDNMVQFDSAPLVPEVGQWVVGPNDESHVVVQVEWEYQAGTTDYREAEEPPMIVIKLFLGQLEPSSDLFSGVLG